jgi:hypothetical protein
VTRHARVARESDPFALPYAMGVLSAASGLLLMAAPRAIGQRYALPPAPLLCRALGLRDLAVGWLLMRRATARNGCAFRALADGSDACLMVMQVVIGRRGARETVIPVLGALALVTMALSLRKRTPRGWQ